MLGDGPIDVVFPPSGFSSVDAVWDWPEAEHFLNRVSSYSRLIIFDQRGTGMSDPIPLTNPPTLEERMDDIRAVMDDAGSDRAVVLGSQNGGPLAILFAAAHPDRTAAMVLINSAARFVEAPDYPMGITAERLARTPELTLRMWGRFEEQDPNYDERRRRQMASYQRAAMSPSTASAILTMNLGADVRDVLPSIRVPTLIIQRRDLQRGRASFVSIESGRYLAEHIDGARILEVPGWDPLWMDIGDDALDEMEEFLTGVRPIAAPTRVLATVLFTDIVSSTETAADVGDQRWMDTLKAHDAAVARQIDRHQGRLISTEGDGAIATFDGPARAIRCALSIRDAVRNIGVRTRAGLHAGEVQLVGNDIGGLAVHIGARVSALAGPGEVLVSSTVKDLVVGSGIEFEERGSHELRGVPGEWRIYQVKG